MQQVARSRWPPCARLHNRWQQRRLFVDAVTAYCGAVTSLASALANVRPRSPRHGRFQRVRQRLPGFAGVSWRWSTRPSEMVERLEQRSGTRYSLRGTRVTVSGYQGEPDYAQEVEAVFARFREGAVKDYRAAFRGPLDMNCVEGQVLDLVARLNPGPFGALDRYFSRPPGLCGRRRCRLRAGLAVLSGLPEPHRAPPCRRPSRSVTRAFPFRPAPSR